VYQSESANLLLNLQNNIYETIKDIVDRILMTYFWKVRLFWLSTPPQNVFSWYQYIIFLFW